MSYFIDELYPPELNRRRLYVRGTGQQFDRVREILIQGGWVLKGRFPSFNQAYNWMCYITFPPGRDQGQFHSECRAALTRAGIKETASTKPSGSSPRPGPPGPASSFPGAAGTCATTGGARLPGPGTPRVAPDAWEKSLLCWLEFYFGQQGDEVPEAEIDLREVHQLLRHGHLYRVEDLINKYLEDGGEPLRVARWQVQLFAAMGRWDDVWDSMAQEPSLSDNPIYAAWQAEAAFYARRHEDVINMATTALGKLECILEREEDEDNLYRRMHQLLSQTYSHLGQPNLSIKFFINYLKLSWAGMDELDREDLLDDFKDLAQYYLSHAGPESQRARQELMLLFNWLPPEAMHLAEELALVDAQCYNDMTLKCEQEKWVSIYNQWDLIHSESPYEAAAMLERNIGEGPHLGAEKYRAMFLLARTLWEDIKDEAGAAQIMESLYREGLDSLEFNELQEGLSFMIKHSFSSGNIDGVLELTERFLSQGQQGDVLGLRGLALTHKGPEYEDEALRCLEGAQHFGYVNSKILRALGEILTGRDRGRAKQCYLKLLEEKWDDMDAMISLLLLEDDPREMVSRCEDIISRLETPQQAFAHSDVLVQRLEAMLQLGLQEGLTGAFCDLVEIYLENGLWDSALSLYHRARLALTDKYQVLEVLDSLEMEEKASCRDQLASQYLDLAVQEMGQASPDSELLRGIGERLFFLSKDAFVLFKDEYIQLQKRLLANRDFVSAKLDDFSDPLGGIDLGQDKVVIVGGYQQVRERAKSILRSSYGLKRYSEVPPHWENKNFGIKETKERLRGATIIVHVQRCLKHSNTYNLEGALNSIGGPRPISVMGKGFSSIVQAVMSYCRQRDEGRRR